MSADAPVAIVGGGIAGLCIGLTLRRRGLDAVVYEQAETPNEFGAGVQLAPNATKLLARLGLGQQLAGICAAPARIQVRRWANDAVLTTTTLGTTFEQRFGGPYYTAHRGDLHSILLTAFGSQSVRYGARCIGLRRVPDATVLEFADGSEASAQIVVGADGIRSTVRACLHQDSPRFSGNAVYRGTVAAAQVHDVLPVDQVTLWIGPGTHCVTYPISAGRLINVVATVPAAEPFSESWTTPGAVSDLLAAYAGWSPRLLAGLARLDSVSRWAVYDRDPLPVWHKGSIVVAGDAAHPMLPFMAQGANQAVEDAATLACCLADTRTETGEGLRRYATLRRARTDQIQVGSRANSIDFHLPDGPRQQDRDKRLARHGVIASDWLYGHDAEDIDDGPRVAAEAAI